MDPATIAAAATALLAPYLAKAGEKAAEKLGEALPENLGKLWGAIGQKFKGKPAAEEAAKDLAAAPADEDNQAAFRKELKKSLSEDVEFVQALTHLLQAAQSIHTESGDIIQGNNNSWVKTNYGNIIHDAGDVRTGDVNVGNTTENTGVKISGSTINGDVKGNDNLSSGNE